MAKIADRVQETTNTTGTGTLTVAGAVAGFRTFAQAVTDGDFADGDTVEYAIVSGTDWEITRGVYTVSGTTLTRAATPDRSSNAGAKINVAAGAAVWCNGSASFLRSLSNPQNVVVNGSFAVNQIVTPTTADNSYPIDGWRLLLGAANAATFVQDAADVPVGAGYAAKLIVGSGNNNKFGFFCPLENLDILRFRGQLASLRVALKATAGLTDGTGKIRMAIVQWTGTADAISATPISAWGAEGTNPTLIANWAFANTPAAIAVTTAWADYKLEGIAISASATNLGVLVWSDDKANTQTTDILRIGGYVTMDVLPYAPPPAVAAFDAELAKCKRYYEKSFDHGTVAPTTTYAGIVGIGMAGGFAGAVAGAGLQFAVTKRVVPTITIWDGASNAGKYSCRSSAGWADNAAGCTTVAIGTNGMEVDLANSGITLGPVIHFVADARL